MSVQNDGNGKSSTESHNYVTFNGIEQNNRDSVVPADRVNNVAPVDNTTSEPTYMRKNDDSANRTYNEDTAYPRTEESTNRRKQIPLIGVLDCGTRTCEFVVFRAQHTEPLVSHQIDIKQVSLSEGWLEENPLEMLYSLSDCVKAVAKKLPMHGYHISNVKAIGITNQRETTVVWDRKTGKPLHNAICWSDTRTESTCQRVLAHLPDQNKNHFKPLSGLPISPYFSVFKLIWLTENVPAVKKTYKNGNLMFGTVDSWILWNITGATNGGIHATDVTNASRTMLMNLDTLNWDPILLHTFKINSNILPEIRSCSEIFGVVKKWSLLHGCPISGIMGNQQSALVGQRCLAPGQAKNTYRSGCFLLYNTGGSKIMSSHGLVTTVAYQLGPLAKPVYALEGSVQVAGAALRWLRVNMGMIGESPESHKANSSVGHLAESDDQGINSTGDVYFVPAFKGLYAPYWRMDARGIICGLTAFTTRAHIVRAALESICYQTRDVLEAMHKDCGYSLTKLYVDGVMTLNPLLMQLQADIIGIPVVRAQTQDATALGVAMAAGQARGIDLWDMSTQNLESVPTETILPTTAEQERDQRYAKWKMAVQRSLGWVTTKRGLPMTEERYKLLASMPGSMFVLISFGLLLIAEKLAGS